MKRELYSIVLGFLAVGVSLPHARGAHLEFERPYGWRVEERGEVGETSDDHTFRKIDTCYHWLEPKQLQAKIDWARKNGGKLYFHGGAVLYCWRSPLGAFSAWEDHGDVLMRIKFRPEIAEKIKNLPRKGTIQETLAAGTSVIYSNDNGWHEYTITPEAVESWSIYHPAMAAEMKAEMAMYDSGKTTADDVFYPFGYFDVSWLHRALDPIIKAHEENGATSEIFGIHPERHFRSAYPLPWREFLDAKKMKVREQSKIVVLETSFGKNLDPKRNKNNALKPAIEFCGNRSSCDYRVSPRYIFGRENPDPNVGASRDFVIRWKCGEKGAVKELKFPAPAENRTAVLTCGFTDAENAAGAKQRAARAKGAPAAKKPAAKKPAA